MAEEKKNGNGNGKMSGGGMVCNCSNCVHGRHWTFFLLRTLVTIIILMMVFWFGVVAGRLADYRGAMRGYGYAMPMRNGGGMMDGSAGMPMIPVNGTTTTSATGGVQNY